MTDNEWPKPSTAHLCASCQQDFATCLSPNIVWGIDRDPAARGAAADMVLECDAYTPNPPPQTETGDKA